MPPELFYPVGAIPCIMVFTAGIPHATSNKKSWFGYWRNDGFVKIKNLGRVDKNGTWADIRDRWVTTFRNREVHPGESVLKQVTAEDEWVVEAYMDTDYSKLTKDEFERVLLDHALFILRGSDNIETDGDEE